jgi:hypothetical protein
LPAVHAVGAPSSVVGQ